MRWVLAVGALLLIPAAIVGAMLMPEEAPAPVIVPAAYLPCADEAGATNEDGLSLRWTKRCIQIPHPGPQPVWDCVGAPEDFDAARWCPPWAEHDDRLWTVTFLDQEVRHCMERAASPLDAAFGAPAGCVYLRTIMTWHPGSACDGLKRSFPEVGGYYQEKYPALFCFSVDYDAYADTTDAAGNVTFTTSLSKDRGELGHIDAEHEPTTCAWSDPNPIGGNTAGCEVRAAAKSQGKMWLPHIAAHIFEPGTGGDHEVFAQLTVTPTGGDAFVVDASAVAEFFILGAG